ncbi:MAG: DUF1269 domain-containing protein [Chloroflexi bacterium]|nr:MAG: DUF1269 domain-containing protein [Chloroflexota bacterium]
MADKYSFIVVRYPRQDTAEAALAFVIGLAKEKIIKLKDAVAITKTEEGKIKLHQTKDDSAGKGFLKGGAIGVLFAILLGPAGWVAAGALLGTAFAMFDRGIKDRLLKELGEELTIVQSALAVLIEDADWKLLKQRLVEQNFGGEVVISELLDEHKASVEALTENAEVVAAVPEEIELVAESAPEAPADPAADEN